MKASACITICILIVLILVIYYYTPPRVEIDVHGRSWSVIDHYDNSTEAAEMLSRLHARMIKFMRYLKGKYHIDETDDIIAEEGINHLATGDARKIIDTLLDNYNPDVFYENDPRSSSDTSYTINKGDSMYVCLRKKKNPMELEDEELVFFVMLHECAHIGNYNGWGHDDRFWTVFKFILHEAVESGVYKPIDYGKYPQDYCGLKVYYLPLNDNTLPNLWEM
jgi:hypothetical protein